MLIVKFLRWLRGYVAFTIVCASPERLITLCARNGVTIWDCVRAEDGFSGKTTVKGYRRLCRFAENADLTPRVTTSRGIPILARRYHKRLGLAMGLALFAAALIAAEQFVWVVEVEGCEKMDPQTLLNTLDDMGIRMGTLKKSIDLRDAAREIQIRQTELSWAALNLHGTTAILRIRERTPPPVKLDKRTPANVVAAEDGQIKQLQVYDGRPLLRVGDTVCKGEIIVGGVWQDRWGITRFLHANASVLAHVPRSLKVEVPLQQSARTLTGQIVKRNYVTVFGARLPLFLYQELEGTYKLEQYETTPMILGAELPFGLAHETYIFYEEDPQMISQEFALHLATKQLDRLESETFGNSPVISRETVASVENGVLVLRGSYEIEADIAEQREIQVFDRSKEQNKKAVREGGY